MTRLPETRFVVVAGLRTGSTLLVSLLDSHPSVGCEGELLAGYHGSSPRERLVSRIRLSNARVFGFHFKLAHAERPGDRLSLKFLNGLRAEGWRFIHVHRRNILRQAASLMIAQQRRMWHDRTEAPPEAWKVRLDPKRFLLALRHAEVVDLAYRSALDRLPHLRVTYEDDLLKADRQQAAADRVFDFLDLPPAPVATGYLRSTTDKLADCVANYEEIVAAVGHTRYARFLDDEGHG